MKKITLLSACIALSACVADPTENQNSSSAVAASSVIVQSSIAPPSSVAVIPSSATTTSSSTAVSSSAAMMSSSSAPAVSSSSTAPSAGLILEENQAGVCGTNTVESEHMGYEGVGYINPENKAGVGVTWSVNAPASTQYVIEIRYANGGTGARSGDLLINSGSTGTHAVNLPVTGAWTSWQTVAVTVDLIQGNNIIALIATGSDGLSNIDSLKIVGTGLSTGACETPTSSSSSSSGSNSSTPPPSGAHMGWAAHTACGPSGTTGGGEGSPTVTVTNSSDLKKELESSGKKVIGVKGKLGGQISVSNVKDKTLIGIGNDATVDGGFRMGSSNNVIIKNMTFSGGKKGQDIDDAFELTGSTCVWFDHSIFRDGGDGNLDVVRASNYITISWNKFYYTQGHGHMLSNLNGNSDSKTDDAGKIKVTFHHNWWGAGVKERMPRTRFGDIHVFNNYYKYEKVPNDTGQNYCVGSGWKARLLVENNYFDGSNNPITFAFDSDTGEIVHRGNVFMNTTGDQSQRGNAFTPPYPYKLDAGEDVKALVTAGAGPH